MHGALTLAFFGFKIVLGYDWRELSRLPLSCQSLLNDWRSPVLLQLRFMIAISRLD